LGHVVVADHRVLRETGAFPPKLEWLSEDFAARFAARDDHGSVWPSEVDGLLASFTAYRSRRGKSSVASVSLAATRTLSSPTNIDVYEQRASSIVPTDV
jgi:hypothetical protein